MKLKLDEKLMTRDEVAAILRVNPRSLCRVPGLRVVRVNKRVLRYRRSDVSSWISNRTERGGQEAI
jgi:hypothetical protein